MKMSKRDESLNDDAIFLCLVRGCVVSACRGGKQMLLNFSNVTTHREKKMEAEERRTAHLIDLIGQLGQDGDAYDAVLNAIL